MIDTTTSGQLPAVLARMLRCPECARPLDFTPAARQPLTTGVFGVLADERHRFPVVDGIPVLRTGRVSVQDHMDSRTEVPGPTVAELVDLVTGEDPLAALVELLAFPPALPFNVERLPGLRLPFTRGPGNRLSLAARRRAVRAALTRPGTAQTAQDWLELCYLRSRNINRELYPYFLMRFGQPRHLASLALLSMLPAANAPVLDLACGFGHLLYYLGTRPAPLAGVGVDRNFFQLWVARRWVAPGHEYVCADAAKPLPFTDSAFSATLCGDAFHLFDDQPGALAELRRCARQDTVIIDRVGNRLLEPEDGTQERDPQGYLALAGDTPHRMIGQAELLAGYLAGHGPDLTKPRTAREFAEEKWLSLVLCEDESLFAEHGSFDHIPHATGHLGLNPIYSVDVDGDRVRLGFQFPSTWYAFENAGMLNYHPAGVRLSRKEFQAAVAGKANADLIARYVQLGMPEHYLRPPRR
jgi:SAM-dependent methyltransferase/uncharacterized protein YbaR (Trm112 family)